MSLSEVLGLENSYGEYFLAFAVLVVAFLVFRILVGIFRKIFMKITSKTKTEIDDILLERSRGPMNLTALFLSFRFALMELHLEDVFYENSVLVIYSGLVIAIGWLLYSFVDVALVEGWKRISKKSGLDVNESITNLVHGVLRIVVIILVFLYVLNMWGIEIVPLLGALGIAGLAVALALQPVLSNIFSGVSVVLDKSVKVGDWIILKDKTWGVVQKIGIRSTKVRTFDNDLIIIPNTHLADSEIRNVSLPAKEVRKTIEFSVAYGSNIEKVKKLVLAELKKVKHVIAEPEPSVKFLKMGDSSLNFKAYFYIDSYENGQTSVDDANTRIYNALNKAKIEIPFPQVDVHLKK